MTSLEQIVSDAIVNGLQSLFSATVVSEQIALEKTKKEFEGDLTFVVFPYVRFSKLNPEQTAASLGEYLVNTTTIIKQYQVVKGFLNLSISPIYWTNFLTNNVQNLQYGRPTIGIGQRVMIEYSSPNTNKPLHLGHVRNNLLGYAIASLMDFCGYEVIKANLINDRGIHICKSMLAWQKFANGETPESSGMKGDHFVGRYYVAFETAYRKEIATLVENGMSQEEAEANATLMKEAREMLLKWEQNDPETKTLWKKMNTWVYAGFEKTYAAMGVSFDRYYYESQTYSLGKDIVQEGLKNNVFYKENDQSVWIDLTGDKLDKKILLRNDGTSVYITQDLGTADLKFQDYGINKSIYVVGNEQDYHFKVLFKILEKLDRPYAEGLYHLSYGMVDLPSGKMKSREGTVVDADDLLNEMFETAKNKSEELGKTDGLSNEDKHALYEMIGLAALKFYILKVDPTKRMMFNPEESIDFHGDTGPFIQYTHARIQSLLSQVDSSYLTSVSSYDAWHPAEIETMHLLYQFPNEVEKAAQQFNPALIAIYCVNLAKQFNRVYKEVSFLREPNNEIKNERLKLAHLTGQTIRLGMGILGINVPNRM